MIALRTPLPFPSSITIPHFRRENRDTLPSLSSEAELEQRCEEIQYAVASADSSTAVTISLDALPSFIRHHAERIWVIANVQVDYLIVLQFLISFGSLRFFFLRDGDDVQILVMRVWKTYGYPWLVKAECVIRPSSMLWSGTPSDNPVSCKRSTYHRLARNDDNPFPRSVLSCYLLFFGCSYSSAQNDLHGCPDSDV